MNFESWSMPWHALQRRVAKSLLPAPKYPDIQVPRAAASSWLMRARGAAASAYRSVR
jgi:hypothetical protein